MYGATEELARSTAVTTAATAVPLASLAATASTTTSSVDVDPRVLWLRRCAPVIMQPQLDIEHGFGLRRVFFDFRPAEVGAFAATFPTVARPLFSFVCRLV